MNQFNAAVPTIPDATLVRRNNHDIEDPVATSIDRSAPRSTTQQRATRATWALWGALASVSGAVATLLTKNPDLHPDVLGNPATTIAALDHRTYQVGVATGLVTVAALIFTAAGWRLWAADHAPRSIAASAVSMALLASAGAMVIAYGLKGTLANYVAGGTEDDMGFTADGLYAVFTFLDFAPFVAWWGVAVAAGSSGWLALVERRVPRWVGVLGLVVSIPRPSRLRSPGSPACRSCPWGGCSRHPSASPFAATARRALADRPGNAGAAGSPNFRDRTRSLARSDRARDRARNAEGRGRT